MRVGIDVCVHFHVYIIPGKQWAKLIRNFNTLRYFYQHSFLDAVLLPRFFIVNEHESTMSFTKENNYSSKFSFGTFHLRVGANTNFQLETFVGLAFDSKF